jgi:hypothetical protein
MEEIKLRIQRISMIHPQISFSIVDGGLHYVNATVTSLDTSTVLIESFKVNLGITSLIIKLKSSLACFATFFGNHRAEALRVTALGIVLTKLGSGFLLFEILFRRLFVFAIFKRSHKQIAAISMYNLQINNLLNYRRQQKIRGKYSHS